MYLLVSRFVELQLDRLSFEKKITSLKHSFNSGQRNRDNGDYALDNECSLSGNSTFFYFFIIERKAV